MKQVLKSSKEGLYYFVDGVKIDGKNPKMSGDCSGLCGDCSGLSGECRGLNGDCTGVSGNCTGLWGECTGVFGDLDQAGITDLERMKGLDIRDLIGG